MTSRIYLIDVTGLLVWNLPAEGGAGEHGNEARHGEGRCLCGSSGG